MVVIITYLDWLKISLIVTCRFLGPQYPKYDCKRVHIEVMVHKEKDKSKV